jgi:hypothetical protein
MKSISISVSGASSAPIIFLISPHTTAEQVLDQLKVKDKDYLLFPESDPSRVFNPKDALFSQVESGDRLTAAVLAVAARAYRRSQLYRQPQQYPVGDPQ